MICYGYKHYHWIDIDISFSEEAEYPVLIKYSK